MRVTNTRGMLAGVAVAILGAVPNLHSQASDPRAAALTLPVGSSLENYVRYSQTLGRAPLTAWTIRPLPASVVEILMDSLTRGGTPGIFGRPTHRLGRVRWQPLPAIASLWYNTTYPFGWNDGAVWRGRGATAAFEAGVAARWNALSVTIDPTAFITENRAFPLVPVPFPEDPYADPLGLTNIDRPQRFGSRSYGQVGWGQSTIGIDAFGLTAGFSTANQWLGPMSEWPLLLSNNAAGFPHAFAGSAKPWNIGIGRVNGRLFYGGLTQSAYMARPDSNPGRFITGVTGSFFPRWMPDLEIGAARVFEYAWPRGGLGWADYRKPIESFLKEHLTGDSGLVENQSADNQLASVFARWVFPSSGIEVYGEFGREDHSWNARDAIAEPEHGAAYAFGLRKGWDHQDGIITGFRAEIVNFDPSTFQRARPQGFWYGHTYTRQGHTERGQVLGTGFAAVAGGGSLMSLERLNPAGDKTSLSFTRMVLRQRPSSFDVQYAISGERTRRKGAFRVTYGLTAVYEMNRDFSADVGNVMTTLVVSR